MRRPRSLPAARVGQRVVIVVGALAGWTGQVVKCEPSGYQHLDMDAFPPGVIVRIHCRHVRPKQDDDAPLPPTMRPPG